MHKLFFSRKQLNLSKGNCDVKCEVFVNGEFKEYTEYMKTDEDSAFDDAVVVYKSETKPRLRIDGVEQDPLWRRALDAQEKFERKRKQMGT